MKMLNLDDIALDSDRKIRWKGQEYKVKDFNVQEFIRFQKLFAEFQKAYQDENEGAMERTVVAATKLVELGVDGFPADGVSAMNPIQMLAVVSMIANLLPSPDEETAAEVSAVEKKEEASPTTEE